MSKYTFEEKYEAVQRVLDGNRWISVPIKNRKSSNHADLRPGITIGVTGFEPAAPCSQSRCSSQTEPHPVAQMLFYMNVIVYVKKRAIAKSCQKEPSVFTYI